MRYGDDLLAVSLIGRRGSSEQSAHTWMGLGEPIGRAAGGAPVGIWAGPEGTLVVDLARAPDVITIMGPDEAPRRHARRLAEQLVAVGTRVSVTAGTFDEWVPVGCRLLSDLRDPALVEAVDGPGPHIVFCAGWPARGRPTESRSPWRSIG